MEEACPLMGRGLRGEVADAIRHLGFGWAALLLLVLSAGFGELLPTGWPAVSRWLLAAGLTSSLGITVAVIAARRGLVYSSHWTPTAAGNSTSLRFTLGSRHAHSQAVREVRVLIRTPLGAKYEHQFVQPMGTNVGIDLWYPDTIREHGTRFAHDVVPGTYQLRWEGRRDGKEPWTVLVASDSLTVA